mgnify:FL=1|tara:strand:+ start:303 stop:848 length:546 start_codon:yes stop_codon:yes gene_type:complete
MALWGNKDNITSRGTVTVDYAAKTVLGNAGGSGTQFGAAGSAQVGDVIRFTKGSTYFGDAVITSITDARNLSIGSTAGLSGAAISGSDFTVSQLPKFTITDSSFSEANPDGADEYVFGVADTTVDTGTAYETGAGWVGVQTYMDNSQNPAQLRIKKEVLVAMSGITTGNDPRYPANPPSNG